MKTERWRAVVDHEGRYEVSDLGRVRSCGHYIPRGGFVPGRLLRPQYRRSAEVQIGKGNTRKVHQLVLEAFVGPRPEGLESLHRDDNIRNNKLSNLRYGTRLENARDAVRNGRYRHTRDSIGRFM